MSGFSRYCLICGHIADSKVHGLSYHRFPKHNLKKWLKFFDLQLQSLKVKVENAELCSRHFYEKDFMVAKNGARRLIKDSVPTIRYITENDLHRRKICLTDPAEPNELSVANVKGRDDENKLQQINSTHMFKTYEMKHNGPKYKKNCLLCGRQSNSHLSFFTFPKDNRRDVWLKACDVTGEVSANAQLCSRHFKLHHFSKPPGSYGRPRLETTAIPTVFFQHESANDGKNSGMVMEYKTLSENVEAFVMNDCEVNERLTAPVSEFSSLPSNLTPDASCSHIALQEHGYGRKSALSKKKIRYPGDIGTLHADTPTSARRSIELLKKSIARKNLTIRNLRKQLARKTVKIRNLLTTVKLANKNLIDNTDSGKQIIVS